MAGVQTSSGAADVAKVIYSTLKHEILNLTIKPGEEVSEGAVCQRFGSSRTPVREAFLRLQNSGLLTTVPYKGSCASLLDYNAIKQVVFMRGIVEAAVLSDFIHSITPYQIEELRYRLNLQKVLLENDFDPIKFYNADIAFHAIWFTHQDKLLVWKIIQKSQQQYSRFRMLDLDSSNTSQGIFEEHVELFELIENQKEADAAKMIKKHLDGGLSRVSERITNDYAHYFLKQ